MQKEIDQIKKYVSAGLLVEAEKVVLRMAPSSGDEKYFNSLAPLMASRPQVVIDSIEKFAKDQELKTYQSKNATVTPTQRDFAAASKAAQIIDGIRAGNKEVWIVELQKMAASLGTTPSDLEKKQQLDDIIGLLQQDRNVEMAFDLIRQFFAEQ